MAVTIEAAIMIASGDITGTDVTVREEVAARLTVQLSRWRIGRHKAAVQI